MFESQKKIEYILKQLKKKKQKKEIIFGLGFDGL